MKLLAFSIKLKALRNSTFAVHEIPFLGGMLHGAWEHQIRSHCPEAITTLGLGIETGAPKRYAILPPPYGFEPPVQEDGSVHLGFGVMLYGNAGEHAASLINAFTQCRYLSMGALRDTIEQMDHREIAPGVAQDFPSRDGIHLHWITPLLLDSQGQRKAGKSNEPPSLIRVVRSVARKISQLEPEMAVQLGLQSPDWIAAEESIRSLSVEEANWQCVSWRYGSRTKEAPVQFNGHMGTVEYRGPLCSSIHQVLQWGAWFGAGQRTALGQGFYRIGEAV